MSAQRSRSDGFDTIALSRFLFANIYQDGNR